MLVEDGSKITSVTSEHCTNILHILSKIQHARSLALYIRYKISQWKWHKKHRERLWIYKISHPFQVQGLPSLHQYLFGIFLAHPPLVSSSSSCQDKYFGFLPDALLVSCQFAMLNICTRLKDNNFLVYMEYVH